MRKEDIKVFLDDMRKQEQKGQPKGYVPEEYSRPDGTPYETMTDDGTLYNSVKNSKCGIWGPGKNPPKPLPGVDPGGWRPI